MTPRPVRKLPTYQQQEVAVCGSYLWPSEIALVREMVEIKRAVRAARAEGDEARVIALRERFLDARRQMEVIRRERLDSLGWPAYD